MRDRQVKLLENLIRTLSPSGFEDEIAEFIRLQLLQYLPRTKVEVDFQKNVTAVIKGTSNKVVMIDAHSDQIGFIVNNIDRGGLISLNFIGGSDTSILSARELVILTDKGKVNAVVNRKHSHLVENEEDIAIEKIHDAVVDIGIRGRRKSQSVVEVGDPVVYKPSFNHLRESYYSGYGFDDKAGCFVLLETIKEIIQTKKKPIPTLIFSFSVQEEVWGKKCRPLLKKYKPDLFIEVDVTFASDWEDDEDNSTEREVGRCKLGEGLVVYRGVDIDKKSLRMMESAARNHKIKIQHQANVGIGYTSTDITHENQGIKALILGIPLRNMHTPVEIINMKDIDHGVKLLTSFLLHSRIESVLTR